jgi:hypothetical protein
VWLGQSATRFRTRRGSTPHVSGFGPRSAPRAGTGAESEGDCPQWFPDLRCERSGRYEGFEKPIVAPFLFEDPFITTGAYLYYIWHEFPDRSALGGGDVSAVALQLRVALTDRLAFIATKDGYVWERPNNPVLRDQQGWLNLAGGLKYALIDRPEDNFMLSPALRLEVGSGSQDIFEGGKGGWLSSLQLIPSVSAAWGLEDLHLIGGLGGKIPIDTGEYGSQIFYHLYADYAVTPRFQPFVQLSGIYYVESGNGKRELKNLDSAAGAALGEPPLSAVQSLLGTGPFEGADYHNLGSAGMDNEDFITIAVGTHVPITKHITFSVAYERPISNRKDIFKQRVTSSLRLEF